MRVWLGVRVYKHKSVVMPPETRKEGEEEEQEILVKLRISWLCPRTYFERAQIPDLFY